MRIPVPVRRPSNLGASGVPCHLLLFAIAASAGCSEGEPSGGASGEPAERERDEPRPVVLCLGDSLTEGYGLDDRRQAYPALLQEKADAAGLDVRVENAGSSGETTSLGLRRIDWLLKQHDVAVLLIALGGNDGLRGIDVPTIEENLNAMIVRTRELEPEARIVLAGMQSPPSMGEVFTVPFRAVFPRVAAEQDVPLVPFLLEGVGGEDAMNQSDGIHPNAAGQAVVAQNVWEVLEPVLREVLAERQAAHRFDSRRPDTGR